MSYNEYLDNIKIKNKKLFNDIKNTFIHSIGLNVQWYDCYLERLDMYFKFALICNKLVILNNAIIKSIYHNTSFVFKKDKIYLDKVEVAHLINEVYSVIPLINTNQTLDDVFHTVLISDEYEFHNYDDYECNYDPFNPYNDYIFELRGTFGLTQSNSDYTTQHVYKETDSSITGESNNVCNTDIDY